MIPTLVALIYKMNFQISKSKDWDVKIGTKGLIFLIFFVGNGPFSREKLQRLYKASTTLLQRFYNASTTLLQRFYNASTTLLQRFYNASTTLQSHKKDNASTTLLQRFYNASTTLLQRSYNASTTLLQRLYKAFTTLLQRFNSQKNNASTTLLRLRRGVAAASQRRCCGVFRRCNLH